MQKLILKLNNRATITLESNDAKELIKEAAFWDALPVDCPVCGATLQFTYREPQNYKYYGLHCLGTPSHETTFGIHQNSAQTLFYKEREQWKTAGQHDQSQTNGNGHQQQHNGQFQEVSIREIDNPVARSLQDLLSPKQLGMIRALARAIGVDHDDECKAVLGCNSDELSKKAASAFIGHLQSKQSTSAAQAVA